MSMRDFFQLLYRVRQPNNDTFIVYLEKPLSHRWKRNKGVKRKLPDCSIYHNLVKRLDVELRSSNSLSYKQIFKKFCEGMNIEIIDGVETLTDEENSAIEATFDYSQNMFAWSNIRDLNSAEYEIYREQLMTSSMDAEAFLQMEKFEFKKLVLPHAQEEKWDQEKRLVYAIASLIRHEEKLNKTWFKPLAHTRIIYDFYKTNNLKHGDKIALNAICTTPFTEIKEAFGFQNAPTSYQTHLYSKLLNIYFESNILYKDYEQSSSGKRYAWESEAQALGAIYEMIQTYKKEQMRQLLFEDGDDSDVDVETTLIMKADSD
ncbi:hypothetical protein HK104_000130 [Borealophlyctis nickersoniae]|nr:hypothetical protein HK104_000130 [Borealophlyctis nickersoniae]